MNFMGIQTFSPQCVYFQTMFIYLTAYLTSPCGFLVSSCVSTSLSLCAPRPPKPHEISCDRGCQVCLCSRTFLSLPGVVFSHKSMAYFFFTSDLCSNMLLSESSSCQLCIKSESFILHALFFFKVLFLTWHILFFVYYLSSPLVLESENFGHFVHCSGVCTLKCITGAQ